MPFRVPLKSSNTDHHPLPEMIAVQQAQNIPDPLSVPANAPEHCPVSYPYNFHLTEALIVHREQTLNSQANQMPVLGVPTKKYVHLDKPKDQILLFLLSLNGWPE